MPENPREVRRRIVAIDGPAGAGKSTIAARLAARFGLLNLETGAMYRAFALKALAQAGDAGSGLSEPVFDDAILDDAVALEQLAAHTTIALQPGPSGNRVLLDGADVTAQLRDTQITQAASRVSVHPAIRAWMVRLQRALGEHGNVVMEGRDIGTAVFPDADVKIFLDASPEVRSQRRYEQGTENGAAASPPRAETTSHTGLAAVLKDLRERDDRDRNRAQSPLRPASDAVVIDSTYLTLDEVSERIEALLTARWARAE